MYNYNLHGECSVPFWDNKQDIPVEQYRYEENRTIYSYLLDKISKLLPNDNFFIRTYKQTNGFAGDQMDVYFIYPLARFPQGCEDAIEQESWKFTKIKDNKVVFKEVDYGPLGSLERCEFGICNFLMHDRKEEIKRRLREELTRIDNIDFVSVYEIMCKKAIAYIEKEMDSIARLKARREEVLNKAKAANQYAFAGDEKYGFTDKGRYLEMVVPKPLMPHLIGSGGSAIKRVQSLLGKRIKLIPVDAPCYTKRCGWII